MCRWYIWVTLLVSLMFVMCNAEGKTNKDKIDDFGGIAVANNKIERSNEGDLDMQDLDRFDRHFVTELSAFHWHFWLWRRRWWTIVIRIAIPWWRRWWFWRWRTWRIITIRIRVRHFWWWCDPHYSTLDGATYDFHGSCANTLVTTCDPSVPQFTVTGENFFATPAQAANKVSSLKRIIVEVFGYTIIVDQGKVVTVNGVPTINDEVLLGPGPPGTSFVTISRNGDDVVICATIGLYVTFNGRNSATVNLADTFMGKVCGLLGNFNDDENDDFMLKGGGLTGDINEFGNSWKDDRFSNAACEAGIDGNAACPPGRQPDVDAMCGRFHNAEFAGCHEFVPPGDLESECVYDMCADFENIDLLCTHYSKYAEECSMNTSETINWRAFVRECDVICGPNAQFEEKVESCMMNTCQIPDASALCEDDGGDLLTTPGCVCDTGYLMEDGACILPSECGCVGNNGVYHPVGEEWDDCGTTCTCTALDTITCDCVDFSIDDCDPDSDAVCICEYPQCPRTCTVTTSGWLTHMGNGSQLNNNMKHHNISFTLGGDTDPCKVKIKIRMDQNQVNFAAVGLGVWPGKDNRFARNYVFNLWTNEGLSERGFKVKGIVHHTTGTSWTDGTAGVTITKITSHTVSWKLVATCDGGTMLTLYYGVAGRPLFDLDVPFPDMWDGLCFPK